MSAKGRRLGWGGGINLLRAKGKDEHHCAYRLHLENKGTPRRRVKSCAPVHTIVRHFIVVIDIGGVGGNKHEIILFFCKLLSI